MYLEGIARYPIKGLSGENLTNTVLNVAQGVPGDREFALGIDPSIDDGTWHSSRSYLINSRNDNLLKFGVCFDRKPWVLTAPSGLNVRFDPDDAKGIDGFNEDITNFLSPVDNAGRTPQLIKRGKTGGPQGHWDFPDTEILVVNLATVRDLENTWKVDVDPRRFRANLSVDGIPAWSEFGYYGSEFSVGGAKIEFLRPARRCAALAVNPSTGERDVAFQKQLVQAYGHGFLGVYARVSQGGAVTIGDKFQSKNRVAIAAGELTCDIAPDVTLWPKTARIEATSNAAYFAVHPVGPLPLADMNATGRMNIHIGPNLTVRSEIIRSEAKMMVLRVHAGRNELAALVDQKDSSSDFVILSGPFENSRDRLA